MTYSESLNRLPQSPISGEQAKSEPPWREGELRMLRRAYPHLNFYMGEEQRTNSFHIGRLTRRFVDKCIDRWDHTPTPKRWVGGVFFTGTAAAIAGLFVTAPK